MRNIWCNLSSAVLLSLTSFAPQCLTATLHDALVEKSKMSFVNALNTVEKVLFTCASVPLECGLSDKDSNLSYGIYKEIMFNMQPAVSKNLIFKSGAAEPGFFDVDGAPRIAVTEYRVGAPIYVNTDLLAVEDDAHNVHGISYEQASAILVHEMGHHLSKGLYGTLTHEHLDALGSSISLYIQQHRTSETLLLTGSNAKNVPVKVSHIELIGQAHQGQDKSIILVESPTDEHLVKPEYKKIATCPRAFYRGTLVFEGFPFDFSFRKTVLSLTSSKPGVVSAEISFSEASADCINKVAGHENEYQSFDGYGSGSLTFNIQVLQDGITTIDKSSFIMNVTTPDDVQYY